MTTSSRNAIVSTLTPLPNTVQHSRGISVSACLNGTNGNCNEILLVVTTKREDYTYHLTTDDTRFFIYNINTDTWQDISANLCENRNIRRKICFSCIPIKRSSNKIVLTNWRQNRLHLLSNIGDIKDQTSCEKLFDDTDKSAMGIGIYGEGDRCITYKNWLFRPGGKITIYNLNQWTKTDNNEKQLSVIGVIKLPNYYTDHGFILKSVNEKIRDNDNCNGNCIEFELLIFGGDDLSFVDSFVTIKVSIDGKVDDKNKVGNTDNTDNTNTDAEMNMKSGKQHTYNVKYSFIKDKYSFNNYKALVEEQKIKFNNHVIGYAFKAPLKCFGYFFLKQRYLIIIGATSWDPIIQCNFSNRIIYFDFEHCRWYMSNIKLPTFMRHEKAFVLSKNETFIHVFGFDHNYKDNISVLGYSIHGDFFIRIPRNIHYRLNICMNIEWKLERLIWIGFYKNITNNKCYIAWLAKDIVKYLLSFVSGLSLIQQA